MDNRKKILIVGGGISAEYFAQTLRKSDFAFIDVPPDKDYSLTQITAPIFDKVFDFDYSVNTSKKAVFTAKKKRKSRQHHGKR